MLLCGFHHLVRVQMDNEEWWLRDAIKYETMDLILWNLMAKHQRRLRMGLTLHLWEPTFSLEYGNTEIRIQIPYFTMLT